MAEPSAPKELMNSPSIHSPPSFPPNAPPRTSQPTDVAMPFRQRYNDLLADKDSAEAENSALRAQVVDLAAQLNLLIAQQKATTAPAPTTTSAPATSASTSASVSASTSASASASALPSAFLLPDQQPSPAHLLPLEASSSATQDILSRLRLHHNMQRDSPHLYMHSSERYTTCILTLMSHWRTHDPSTFDSLEAAIRGADVDVVTAISSFVSTLQAKAALVSDSTTGATVAFHVLAYVLSQGSLMEKPLGPFGIKCADAVERITLAWCRNDFTSISAPKLQEQIRSGSVDSHVMDSCTLTDARLLNEHYLDPALSPEQHNAAFTTLTELVKTEIDRLARHDQTPKRLVTLWKTGLPRDSVDLETLIIEEKKLWLPVARVLDAHAPHEYERVLNLLDALPSHIRDAFKTKTARKQIHLYDLKWHESLQLLQGLMGSSDAASSWAAAPTGPPADPITPTTPPAVPKKALAAHTPAHPGTPIQCPVHPELPHDARDCKLLRFHLGYCGDALYADGGCTKDGCSKKHDVKAPIRMDDPAVKAAVSAAKTHYTNIRERPPKTPDRIVAAMVLEGTPAPVVAPTPAAPPVQAAPTARPSPPTPPRGIAIDMRPAMLRG